MSPGSVHGLMLETSDLDEERLLGTGVLCNLRRVLDQIR